MSSEVEPRRPRPWDYSDHRTYLKAMIAYLTATKKNFSFRQFSRKAGYASPNYLRLIADGTRNLSNASIGRFARALGLNSKEHDAFEALVLLAQARNDEERNRHYERLRRGAAKASPARQLERAQFDIYSHWYILPIREMLLLPDFKEDTQWIAKRLSPPIKPSEAARALELLQKVGLTQRDDTGKLAPADVKLTTPAKVQSLAFRNYHRALIKHTERALDRLSADVRNVTSVTVCLSPRQYKRVCDRIEEFRLELMDTVEDEPSDDERKEVHVLGFQVVPLTREKPDEK